MVVAPQNTSGCNHQRDAQRIITGITSMGLVIVQASVVVRYERCGREWSVATHEGQKTFTVWEE